MSLRVAPERILPSDEETLSWIVEFACAKKISTITSVLLDKYVNNQNLKPNIKRRLHMNYLYNAAKAQYLPLDAPKILEKLAPQNQSKGLGTVYYELLLQTKIQLVLQTIKEKPSVSTIAAKIDLLFPYEESQEEEERQQNKSRNELLALCENITDNDEIANQQFFEENPFERYQQQLIEYLSDIERDLGPAFLENVRTDIAEGLYNPYNRERNQHQLSPLVSSQLPVSNDNDMDKNDNMQPLQHTTNRTRNNNISDPPENTVEHSISQTTSFSPIPVAQDMEIENSESAQEQPGDVSINSEPSGILTFSPVKTTKKQSKSSKEFRATIRQTPRSEAGRRKYTDEEVDRLLDGVMRYGIGHWADILAENRDVFKNRTSVDLKDKWRNIKKDCDKKNTTISNFIRARRGLTDAEIGELPIT